MKQKKNKENAKTVESYWPKETIIYKLDDKYTINLLKKLAKDLKLKLLTPDCPEDWMALPYFIIIANPNLLSTEEIKTINYMMGFNDTREMSIVLTTKPKSRLPVKMRKFLLKPADNIDYDYLKIVILQKRASIQRHEKTRRHYDNKIYRLMYILLSLSDKNKIVTTQSLCDEFNVSEKTIHRDIELLTIMGNIIEFDKKQRRWIMTFCISKFNYDYAKEQG